MNDNIKKENYLGQAWLVIVLSLLFGASLAGVQVLLKSKIENNKLAETLKQIPSLVTGADKGEKFELNGKLVYKVYKGSKQIGWVIPSKGVGFADQIEVLIGVDGIVSKITGLYVLDQKETPGLGNKIVEKSFLSQFENKNAKDSLNVVKSTSVSGNDISAITGATISTNSVCGIINVTLNELRTVLAENFNKENK